MMISVMRSLLGMWLLLLGSLVAGQGELPLLLFNGRVLNDQGEPLDGAQVQFWQTDRNGNYDHPGFNRNGMDLDTDFQYFGTAMTTENGFFQFLTYRPGIYQARPITHIHYKVWYQEQDIFTSQFYFADEGFTQFSPLLQLDLLPQDDGSVLTNKTIVVDLGLGGSELITPSQQEGPFYPVVDFFGLDSDMTNLAKLEQGTPSPTRAPAVENPPTMASPIDAPSTQVIDPETTADLPRQSPSTISPTETASCSSTSSTITSSLSILAFFFWITIL
jgi:hypothetical protein